MKLLLPFVLVLFAAFSYAPDANSKELTFKQVVQILNNYNGVLVGSEGDTVRPRSPEGRSIIDQIKNLKLAVCLESAKYCLDCNGGGAASSALCGKMCKCPTGCEDSAPGSICSQVDEGTILVFEP